MWWKEFPNIFGQQQKTESEKFEKAFHSFFSFRDFLEHSSKWSPLFPWANPTRFPVLSCHISIHLSTTKRKYKGFFFVMLCHSSIASELKYLIYYKFLHWMFLTLSAGIKECEINISLWSVRKVIHLLNQKPREILTALLSAGRKEKVSCIGQPMVTDWWGEQVRLR